DKEKDVTQAIEMFRHYLQASPDGHFARDVVARLSGLPDFHASDADRDNFGKVHYLHGEWDQALPDWNQTTTDKRWYERATCLLRLGRTKEAREDYQKGSDNNLKHKSLPESTRV